MLLMASTGRKLIDMKHRRKQVVAALIIMSSVVSPLRAESDEEQQARIIAAQKRLEAASTADEDPDILKSRLRELEAENRRLQERVRVLKEALQKAGIEVPAAKSGQDEQGEVGQAENVRTATFRSLRQWVGKIPPTALPPGRDRNTEAGWLPKYRGQVSTALKDACGQGRFVGIRGKVGVGQRMAKRAEGPFAYRLLVRTEPFTYAGLRWQCHFDALVFPKNDRDEVRLRAHKPFAEMTLNGEFVGDAVADMFDGKLDAHDGDDSGGTHSIKIRSVDGRLGVVIESRTFVVETFR